jgi:hypothetical protein
VFATGQGACLSSYLSALSLSAGPLWMLLNDFTVPMPKLRGLTPPSRGLTLPLETVSLAE